MRGRWAWMAGLPGLTVLLAVWSVLVRVIVAASDSVSAFYFPDSWNYVVLPSSGEAHPFHGPYIYSVWDALIPGTPTEASVVMLQTVLGLIAVQLVWATLRRLVAEPIAFAASLLFAAQPLTMFFERTILTEAVSVVVVAALLFLVTQAMVSRTVAVDVAVVGVAGLLAGVLVALRPASRFAIVAPLLVLGAIVVHRYWRRVGAQRFVGLGLVGLLLVGFVVAPLQVRSTNRDQFGTASLTPAAGTAVLAWWGWRLPCEPNADYTPEAQAALAASCDQDEPVEQLMWAQGAVNRSLEWHEGFAATQSQLASEATAAMFDSPAYTAGRMVTRGWTHAIAPTVNLERYSNGSVWFRDGAIERFAQHEDWFGGDRERVALTADPAVFSLVRQTARLPGVLTLLIVIAGLVGGGRSMLRRRSAGVSWTVGLAPRDQNRILITGAALGMVAANEAIVALGGLPIFRYWVPMLPAIFIAGAIVIDSVVDSAAE